jgi:LacI family transcriptional regulator
MPAKRTTIKDVAKLAEVSIGVVSFVLNNTPGQSIPEGTRQRIIEAARQLNYTPNAIARGMRTKQSKAIGLVSFWDITEHAFIEILNGVYSVADRNDYTVVLCNLKQRNEKFNYIELFNRQQVDGIIFISPYNLQKNFCEIEHVNSLIEHGIPSVVLYGHTNHEGMNYINVNHYSTTYQAAKYLLKLEHKKIGYILPSDNEAQDAATRRFQGFVDALGEYAIEVDRRYIFKLEDTDRIIKMICNNEGPSGIVAYKCDYAQRFLGTMISAGISVPEQISLIAANNEPYARYLYPPLTTVQIPFSEMGEKAAELLLNNFNNKIIQSISEVEGKLCIRDSCKALI